MIIVEGYGNVLCDPGNGIEMAAHGYNQLVSEYGQEKESHYRDAGKHLVIVTIITAEEKGYAKAKIDVAHLQFKDGVLELERDRRKLSKASL